jgi:hypothetical protein
MRIASKLLTSRRFIDSFAQRVGETEAAEVTSVFRRGPELSPSRDGEKAQETSGPTFLGPALSAEGHRQVV